MVANMHRLATDGLTLLVALLLSTAGTIAITAMIAAWRLKPVSAPDSQPAERFRRNFGAYSGLFDRAGCVLGWRSTWGITEASRTGLSQNTWAVRYYHTRPPRACIYDLDNTEIRPCRIAGPDAWG